ncbi:MAG: GNAT family N-acetyltransferase [Acidobacteria bacterium]|nr:GNAT family N-acetyltransferase [Acidobacteriota bacterium]
MAASDPWRTLGRGHEDCLARVEHPEYTLLLARREGRPLGFVLLHPRGVAGSPYIAAIAVDEDARGQGIGRLLLERAENWWPEARHIFLCVSSFNDGARLLYQRCGYQVVGELIDYVIEGASEILMHKRLAGR